MKRSSTGRSIAVYDFDEGDDEPFSMKIVESAKRSKLFESFFKGKQDSRAGGKNERNNCKDLTERPTKSMCCENVIYKETNASQSSSVSDVIETDDSDLESNQKRNDVDTRFGGAVGVSTGVFKDEDPVAEEGRKVRICGEELWLFDEKYSSPEFIFTAATIELTTQAFGAVKLPFSMLKNLRSGSHEEGLYFIELDLTEHGVKFLRQHLRHSDNYTSCHTIWSTFSDNSEVNTIKQITSLSDGYKLIWRPGKECRRHHSEKCVNSVHRYRDGLDNGENDRLLGDCIVYRSRACLNDWCDLIYPTEDDRDAVTVTKYDYLLLDPDQFLSDTIIDFYIKYLQSQIPEADKKSFYFYNSFFFRKLTEVDKNLQIGLQKSKSTFERVKRWTAGINIFEKDYLFVPIMQSAHWSLVIICHPGYLSAGCSGEGDSKAPEILHLDSLEGCHTCVEEPIQSYLVEAWRERNSHNEDFESLLNLKFVPLKVPQQTNYSDCGLFLLHYVELFIYEVLKKNSTDVAFHEWFNPEDASGKRAHIQSLIQDLRAKKSAAGEHVRPQHLTDTYVVRPSDIAQRAVSFGRDICDVNMTSAVRSGNLFDQASSMLVSHHQHLENDTQLSTCTRLGHDHIKLEYVEVVGEWHHFCRCCQHASFDELDNFSLLQQGEPGDHMRPILMPFCTHVEENCVVQSSNYVSLDDSLECGISDVNLEDFHAPVEANNQRDDGTTIIVDVSDNPDVVEERFTCAISDPLVNSSTEVGVAFCWHYDDERIFDTRFRSARNFSLDETSSEQVFHTRSTNRGSSAVKPGRLKEINAANDGSIAVGQESNHASLRDSSVWLGGKEAVDIDLKNVTIQHTAVESRQEIATDHICMEGSERQPVNEVAGSILLPVNEVVVANRGRLLEKDDDTSVPIFTEGGICDSRLKLTDEESCAVNEAGLDRPHHVPSDRGLIENGKRERASQRSKQSVVRRITRSAARGKV